MNDVIKKNLIPAIGFGIVYGGFKACFLLIAYALIFLDFGIDLQLNFFKFLGMSHVAFCALLYMLLGH